MNTSGYDSGISRSRTKLMQMIWVLALLLKCRLFHLNYVAFTYRIWKHTSALGPCQTRRKCKRLFVSFYCPLWHRKRKLIWLLLSNFERSVSVLHNCDAGKRDNFATQIWTWSLTCQLVLSPSLLWSSCGLRCFFGCHTFATRWRYSKEISCRCSLLFLSRFVRSLL